MKPDVTRCKPVTSPTNKAKDVTWSTRTADGMGFQMMGCFTSNKKFIVHVHVDFELW